MIKSYQLSTVVTLLLFVTQVAAMAKSRITVAQDGTGDYRTVQAAINAAPDHSTETTTIFIKNGTYKEKINLAISKTHITLMGESRDGVILTYDDYAAKQDASGKNIGTSGSSSFFVYGDDFTAVNITFQNSAGPVGQAVAMRVSGTRAYFQNCRFLGFQDTLYTQGFYTKELYRDCYIEGTVDFIFGGATTLFERCTIYCKKGGGYATAAATPDSVKYGYLLDHCKLTGDAPAGTFYLGRPWRPFAKTVYIECDLGNMICPKGWQEWSNKDNLKTTYYGEYESKNAGETKRPDWTHQLNAAEAREYTPQQVLGGWYPAMIK